ncbi:MAG: hypothetical protein ACUZ8A_07160 [Candidatus Bathyanammoxibius sp.]
MATRIIVYTQLSPGTIASSISPAYTPDALDDLLNWLLYSHTTTLPSCLKVVWDLSDFTRAIADQLPAAVGIALYGSDHRARFEQYKFFYIPEKMLSIEKRGTESVFYDLSQYFPDTSEPDTLDGLQSLADQLSESLADLGIPSPTTLSSPVACFRGHELLSGLQDTVPTIFDAPASLLDAYEVALQCTPREWISNYQIGAWDDE